MKMPFGGLYPVVLDVTVLVAVLCIFPRKSQRMQMLLTVFNI